MKPIRAQERWIRKGGPGYCPGFFKEIIITKDAPVPYYNEDDIQDTGAYDYLPGEKNY